MHICIDMYVLGSVFRAILSGWCTSAFVGSHVMPIARGADAVLNAWMQMFVRQVKLRLRLHPPRPSFSAHICICVCVCARAYG